MAEEMRKRLEEAADAICNCQGCPSIFMYGGCKKECVMHEFFKKGFKYGYKEAVEKAKEWLLGHLPTPDWYSSTEEFVSDFESYMNKLWEEKK